MTLFLFTSCSEERTIVDPYDDYVSETATTADDSYDTVEEDSTVDDTVYENIAVDDSWRYCYALTYEFYDYSEGTSVISEYRTSSEYVTLDADSNMMTYVIPSTGYLLEYFLSQDDLQGTVTVITDYELDDLQSSFYLLSVVDIRYPSYSNVTEIGETTVNGRSAMEYCQVGTESTSSTEQMTAYVWVDTEYGFVSKCEYYNSSGTLLMSWELTYFTVDEATVSSIIPQIDLTLYTISSESS